MLPTSSARLNTEVELMQKLIDGVSEVIKLAERLAAGYCKISKVYLIPLSNLYHSRQS